MPRSGTTNSTQRKWVQSQGKEEEWHARPREWQAQRLGGENNLQNVGQEDGAVGPAKVGSYLKSWKLVAHCSWGDSNKERGQGAYN